MPDPATKRCSKCGETKPLDAFSRKSASADGRLARCKKCRAAQYKANRQVALERQRQYRMANHEAVLERKRQYRDANREALREWQRDYYTANRQSEIERQRRYREEDPDINRRYREANRESVLQQKRNYRHANRELLHEREALVYADLRTRVFGHYGTACACCGTAENLSIDHVNGNGGQHRDELFGSREKGNSAQFYSWLAKNSFPPGYQTLCNPCNASKQNGERCRLSH